MNWYLSSCLVQSNTKYPSHHRSIAQLVHIVSFVSSEPPHGKPTDLCRVASDSFDKIEIQAWVNIDHSLRLMSKSSNDHVSTCIVAAGLGVKVSAFEDKMDNISALSSRPLTT